MVRTSFRAAALSTVASLTLLTGPDAAFALVQSDPGAQGNDIASSSELAVDFDIAEQPLQTALIEFARQSGQSLLYSPDLVEGHTANAVQGRMTPTLALSRLVSGADLDMQRSASGAILLRQAAAVEARDTPSSQPTNPAPTRPEGAASESLIEASAEAEPDVLQMDTITVTGTSIRGVNPESSPLDVYSREDFQRLGVLTTDQLLRAIPQNINTTSSIGGLAVSRELNARSVNAVDLRGLGAGSTLTLLNGRRLPLADVGETADASLIPLGAVERVEVLTDGASSIYGADAVAGVVNFVLRDDFEGAETSVSYTTRGDGGYSAGQFDQVLGTSWSGGGVIASLSAATSGPFLTDEVDFSNTPDTYLAPLDQRYSAFVSGRQDLGASAEVFADILYTDRHTKTSTREDGFFQATSLSNTQTEQVVATIGGRIQPVRDWQFELLATYGDYTNNLNIVRFFDDGRLRETNGAQDFSSLEVTGKLDGTLLSLASGDVGFALGGGYLEQELGFGPMRADRATSYAFGELAVPLINEDMAVPLVQRLELNLSGRYTDTSDFGDSFDPKVGLLWAINDELKLRGTYGQAFRAPTLPDLIPSETSYVILPVEGPLGTFPDPFSNDQSTVYYVVGPISNPDLGPETSEAFTLGFDFAPARIEGLTLSSSYFNIDYTDRIAQPPDAFEIAADPETYFDLITDEVSPAIIADTLPGALGLFDARTGDYSTTLDPDAIAADVTHIIYNGLTNIASQQTSGFDVSLDYSAPTSFGAWNVGAAFTYMLENKERISAGAPVVERVGTLTYPVEFRGRLNAGFQHGGWSSQLQLNYVDSYTNTSVTPAEPVDRWVTVDLITGFSFQERHGDLLSGVRVGFNVRNLFNEDPPFARSNSASTIGTDLGVNYDPTNADPFGRLFTLSLSKEW